MKPLIAAGVCAIALSAPAAAQVKVDSAWARPTAPGQPVGGGYLTLRSVGADRLLGGSTPAAERVELHSMAMVGDVMKMRQLDALALPAGRSVKLEPGGMHLMLVGLKAPLKVGDKLALTLKFEKAGEVRAELTVLSGPAPMAAADSKR